MTQDQELGWFARIWRGHVGLMKLFWFYGVAVTVFLWLIVSGILYRLAMGGMSSILFLFFAVVFLSVLVGYQVLVSVGMWKSAGNYEGPKVWAVLARSAVALAGVWLLADLLIFFQVASIDANDPSRNSGNVAAQIDRNPEFPFSGFWKGECGENFGLAIEPSPKGTGYSVSFCGPGGCFKPGTYRPDTTIVNDPMYKIVDKDTIDVTTQEGFSRYIRCQ